MEVCGIVWVTRGTKGFFGSSGGGEGGREGGSVCPLAKTKFPLHLAATASFKTGKNPTMSNSYKILHDFWNPSE